MISHKERLAKGIVTGCASVAIFAICSITIYMILKGVPALFKVGPLELLFGDQLDPIHLMEFYILFYLLYWLLYVQ